MTFSDWPISVGVAAADSKPSADYRVSATSYKCGQVQCDIP